jgi:DNA-binding Xre family transcriptional regulator
LNASGLINELKKELKKQDITYQDLANRMGLSEAAVKRCFALRNFSLRRLDQICESIGIDLADLVLAASRAEDPAPYLPLMVEEELAADPTLVQAFYLVLLRRSPGAIKKELGVQKTELFQIARRLERLGLVDVLPGEQMRSKVRKSLRWRPDGPLAALYGPSILKVFFKSTFRGEFEHQDFLTGMLSPESFKVFKKKLSEIFREFEQLSELDSRADESRTEGFWFYSGIRPWAPADVIGELGGA